MFWRVWLFSVRPFSQNADGILRWNVSSTFLLYQGFPVFQTFRLFTILRHWSSAQSSFACGHRGRTESTLCQDKLLACISFQLVYKELITMHLMFLPYWDMKGRVSFMIHRVDVCVMINQHWSHVYQSFFCGPVERVFSRIVLDVHVAALWDKVNP